MSRCAVGLCLCLASPLAFALNNGLGRTPQMGYNSWYDVLMAPSADLLLKTAAAMKANGLQALGYNYVNLDDGIVEAIRGPDGNLVPDKRGFPQGWKVVSDSLHADGFRFGVYTDRGTKTCGGRASAQGFEAQDAAFYAAAGVDYVKEDSCNAPQDHPTAFAQYAAMRDGLNKTGRPIFFSLCGWNAWYSPVMHALANSARIGPDDINWNGILTDIDDMLSLATNAGPGAFNDGRGNEVVTEAQSAFQFTAWALLSAPMLLSQTIVNMSAARLATYSNAEVIDVGQDIMGRQGILLAGGKLTAAHRSLAHHLARRHGGVVPNPRNVLGSSTYRALSGNGDNTPLTMAPCATTKSTLQQWQWNVTAPFYLSNVGTHLCANTDDCGAGLIAFTCITAGSTCCGDGCMDVLKFSLFPDGSLRTPSQPGMCATSGGAGSGLQVTLTPCSAGSAAQTFTYDASALTLSLAGNQCLTVGDASASRTAVIGRPLVDGAWAVGFFNAGLETSDVVCDAGCLSNMGFEASQAFSIRDLWAHADLPNAAPGANITVSALDADGGVALYRVMPIFTAALPPPPAQEL